MKSLYKIYCSDDEITSLSSNHLRALLLHFSFDFGVIIINHYVLSIDYMYVVRFKCNYNDEL